MVFRSVQLLLPVLLGLCAALLPELVAQSQPMVHQGVLLLPWFLLPISWVVSRLYRQPKVSFLILISLLVYSLLQSQRLHPELATHTEASFWLLCLLGPVLILVFSWLPEEMTGEANNWKCYLIIATIGIVALNLLQQFPQQTVYWMQLLLALEPGLPPLVPLLLLTLYLLITGLSLIRRHETSDGVAFMALLSMGFGFCGFHTEYGPEVSFSLFAMMVVVLQVLHSYRLAFFDPLTGLRNRRSLVSTLLDYPKGYHLAMVDIDHFKDFNDTFGHDVGDEVLRAVASVLERVGVGGKVFRLGGEEFVVVFVSRDRSACTGALQTVREMVAHYPFKVRQPLNAASERAATPSQPQRITVTIGLTQHSPRDSSVDAVLARADKALYRGKSRGRNCLMLDDGKPVPWVTIGGEKRLV
ncbi:diguanylate cyclase (GGDEF) domain-containing protein [Ferrimonas sediminum]|uniref:diguanylate cyclase n=1 Tax=Ferrimonas sediminum TaxID=718193 RepID=A0A1G8TC64_9GAMM|nr:GGDEF domain-containing protein [Ferrimonas sediminum]SDJ38505.1 diguanylate cyclase (GGDEF) domain-containing protein [Ferrimonas sediminum]